MDEHLKPHKRVHSLDSWRVFRILAEFVDGFETMTLLGPSVAMFGSSTRMLQDPKSYELATLIAKKVAEKGFGIITGGGPGIMEAANKGAQEALKENHAAFASTFRPKTNLILTSIPDMS